LLRFSNSYKNLKGAIKSLTAGLNTSEAKSKKSKTDTATNTPTTTTTSTANQSPDKQITSEEKAALCKPNDTSVNATESKVCGIPATTSNSTAEGP
jgi:hypothetical protein